jgi:hypothetical protein
MEHVAQEGDEQNSLTFLSENANETHHLEKDPRIDEDNIKMNLIEMRCKDVKWIQLGEDRGQWYYFQESRNFLIR